MNFTVIFVETLWENKGKMGGGVCGICYYSNIHIMSNDKDRETKGRCRILVTDKIFCRWPKRYIDFELRFLH